MLKAATDKQLILGLIPKELEILKQGQPLIIKLDDVGFPGAVVTIIAGDTNEQLKEMVEAVNRRRALMDSVGPVEIRPDEGPQLDLSKIGSGKKH